MSKTLLIAAAPLKDVENAVAEIVKDGSDPDTITLVSTKSYRLKQLNHYQDINTQNFTEETRLNIQDALNIVVIQHNQTLISYINVYRCLRANEVNDFSIKVAGAPVIQTSVQQVFDLFSSDKPERDKKVRWIDPATITLRHEFSQAQHGQVIGGDWDLQTTLFEQSVLFFDSLKQRVENHIDWEETPYYQDVISSLQQNQRRFGCSTVEQFKDYCSSLDELYRSMAEKGYQQNENDDYVTINIGRDGRTIFNDGRHRLTMAKLLGIKKIPVKVAVRHSQWVEFKDEIRAFADKFYNGKVYAKIQHVDLQDIAFSQEDKRLEIISEHLNAESKTLLDIGSHWGYFCNGLEQHGLQCTAVEADVSNFYFLDKLRIAQGSRFTAINASIFDVVDQPRNVDVVLALNIFHHFIKTEELFEQLKLLLSRLNMKEMYFQSHNPIEPQMTGSFRNYDSKEFVEFLLSHSNLTKRELLVEYPNGRKLFRLS